MFDKEVSELCTCDLQYCYLIVSLLVHDFTAVNVMTTVMSNIMYNKLRVECIGKRSHKSQS